MTGINGGIQVTTGFSHGTVLSVADQVIEAVKNKGVAGFMPASARAVQPAPTNRYIMPQFVEVPNTSQTC